MAASDLSHCAAEVRRGDNDRFLLALFAPAPVREDLLALYAFNLEVARIPEVVVEPTLGTIRLQWWREAIDGIYDGNPPRHPVAVALAGAIGRHSPTRYYFDRLLDARAADLEHAPFAGLDSLERYAAATSGNLCSLTLEICGTDSGPLDAAARAAGTAYALAGILRSVPFHARRGRVLLPAALLGEVDPGALDAGAAEAAAEVAALARRHLAAARAGDRPPRAALPALLPATLAAIHLRNLERSGFDPLQPWRESLPVARHLRLLAAAALRRP